MIYKRISIIFVAGYLLLTALSLLAWRAFPREPREPNLATVLFREGLTVAQASELLNQAGVLSGQSLSTDLEGYLFPDTYEFFVPSSADSVAKRFSENFNKKVLPMIPQGRDIREILTVASLVEREVSGPADRRMVAGIIWKRLRNDFPLQVDSPFCYIKPEPCHPVTPEDTAKDSPYNTYTRKGLPPTPIANPGLDAITAAVNPQGSPYWFYLSDPKTQKTVFAVDLDEHRRNIVKYLK